MKPPLEVVSAVYGAEIEVLEAELSVGGLTAALAAMALIFFQHEVDRRGRNSFLDEAAADACAVGAIPVALDNHRPATARAGAREFSLDHFVVSFRGPAGVRRAIVCESKNILIRVNPACQQFVDSNTFYLFQYLTFA